MRLSVFVIIGAVLSVTICQIRLEKTYLFHKSSKANWFQANVFCETNNLRLVSIHSLEEHDLIVRKMADLGKKCNWFSLKSYSISRLFLITSRLKRCIVVDSR